MFLIHIGDPNDRLYQIIAKYLCNLMCNIIFSRLLKFDYFSFSIKINEKKIYNYCLLLDFTGLDDKIDLFLIYHPDF
jgi:hypothetical protein